MICIGLKDHTHTCSLQREHMHRNHGTLRKWPGLPAGEKHSHYIHTEQETAITAGTKCFKRSSPVLFEGQCLSAAAHKLFDFRKDLLGDEVCPDTNDKEPHYSSLALASVGMKLRHKKTFSLAMSCSCQRTGMWTSQAQEEEKCSYNPGQLSNFRVSIWQHKSRWPSRHSPTFSTALTQTFTSCLYGPAGSTGICMLWSSNNDLKSSLVWEVLTNYLW